MELVFYEILGEIIQPFFLFSSIITFSIYLRFPFKIAEFYVNDIYHSLLHRKLITYILNTFKQTFGTFK